MKYLLDTHTFLWFISNDSKLSNNAISVINNRKNDIFLSQVNIWEMSIKISLGKLQVVTPLNLLIEEFLRVKHINLLSIKNEHIFAVQHLPFHHRDPFDRLLVAQALIEKMSIIGRDVVMDDYSVARVW